MYSNCPIDLPPHTLEDSFSPVQLFYQLDYDSVQFIPFLGKAPVVDPFVQYATDIAVHWVFKSGLLGGHKLGGMKSGFTTVCCATGPGMS